ncbi:MAG: UDP-N-acetylmuramoyl-L-alanyl-D-glutamate--2,6-diaminopimelate ligase [Pirellulales bacterium]|nr:UDP-N-acetylmuramoyl-L-alanyl-D-glutamate--2,6-diaminopimelate ligase [Pirellulales bacterium]
MQACPSLGRLTSLRELLAEAKVFGIDDVWISGCTCDSRRVKPGYLFAALPGIRHDGHQFIAEAVARGCVAVLSPRPVDNVAVPTCVVDHVGEVFGQICQALAGHPSRALKVIGVTGTNGKTTTSCLIASILTTAKRRVGLLGTLGYLDGRAIEESHWTTPPAEQLAAWLARMVGNGCSHAVMEVSSHALDQARVAGVRFDAACVTNVTRDHLDYHPTIDDYRLAKSKLFDYLPAEAFAVINADDPVSAGYLRQIDGPVLTVGIHSAAEITATPIERCLSEQTFLLTAGSETIPVRTAMIGTHHVYNCLVAAAVGLTYGIDLPTVVRGLESAEHVPGRLERLECGQPFGVFVDYAHTPDALEGCLKTLREVTDGRLICVFGAGGDRDRRKRPLMGRAVESVADVALVTSDNPRTEDPETIIRDVLAGFRSPQKAEVVADRAGAIRRALAEARPGDCVLLAGKGHEDYQIVGDRRLPLDDGEIARQWLYEARPHVERSGDV